MIRVHEAQLARKSRRQVQKEYVSRRNELVLESFQELEEQKTNSLARKA